jgi:outer membrane protein assembly factor BamB
VNRSAAVVIESVVIALLLGTCAHVPGTVCRSDFDCKLDRVCDGGRCVWPSRTGAPPRSSPVDPEAPPTLEVAPGAAATNARASDPPLPSGPPAQAMFRSDPQHRGRSRFRLPVRRPQVRWAYETVGAVSSSPAVSKDGWVAVGSHDGRLHVISPEGRSLWAFATGDMIVGSPAISAGGIIYAGSDDDHLYALDPRTRKELWKFRLGACRSGPPGPDNSRCDADGGPTVGPDGTIYVGGDGIYALNPDGTLRWRFATGGHVGTAPTLLADGTIVAGAQDNMIYGLTPSGAKRWDFRAGDDVESTAAVADDGTLYVGSDDQKLYALSPDGGLRWAFNAGGDIRASPAIGLDGTIYVGSFDGLMYAIRPDGTLQWTFRAGDRILSSALVDAAGAILFGAEDDRLYALESSGHLRWSVELFGDVDSSPTLGADGTIYVGADDRKVYALR